ncbi:hypothetical protein RND81_09G051700 [Saponaria officinalis]|uniref:Uncharacterized protein n=1 Tax=Saponaria officinalis TaxID=3572 RepID=A0AAW1IIV6_SAPOF
MGNILPKFCFMKSLFLYRIILDALMALLENKEVVIKSFSDVDPNIKLASLHLLMAMVSKIIFLNSNSYSPSNPPPRHRSLNLRKEEVMVAKDSRASISKRKLEQNMSPSVMLHGRYSVQQ